MAGGRSSERGAGPSPRTRAAIARRLAAASGRMTTAAVAEMDARHPWFSALDAEKRSWITLVAQAGIDGFVRWFSDPDASATTGADVFGTAPRALARAISLQQTVELVRTTIDAVETQLHEVMPRNDRAHLQVAITRYSREVAFAAAEVYARAAEMRGAWDARLEALVVDSVLRGETDETVLSRASTLGWRSTQSVVVVIGADPDRDNALDDVRRLARQRHLDVLAAVQGDRLVVVLGGEALADGDAAVTEATHLVAAFGPGPIVVGPVVEHLVDAARSARAAVSGLRAAVAWPTAPRPVGTDDLLPERALSGDGHARRALATDVYGPLAAVNGDLLDTLTTFLDCGSSMEATARALFVHPNTVRYRLRRIHQVTGFSPTDPRESYVLRVALTLGRLQR
ncbi:PucR family transcriptional regulator [Auraticoccus sp. F435]|uniref:PucR family transcriptional regulator n=1 Tax=Auraticoccus cholistanensis TaxID=2656650 RepID=A0A6A9UXG2_9ACTN|nr:helix-turn-helix domain-containing protein [Auraticoccus cholistanensis]MVA77468.1 PucR family transcriptional regulator [Auraticoccus cholistanensis]